MTENHFRSHFSPFQIRKFYFFKYFFKMAAGGHFGFRFWPKSIGTSLYSMSMATSNMNLIVHFGLSHRVHKLVHHIFTK